MRTLTKLPGGPCVLALCHPIKHATQRDQLVPRGGGAFLAEVDGNLTAWRHGDDLVELHHFGKLRGPGFEPVSFRVEPITTPKLVDSKGRLIPTVRALAISEAEAEKESSNVRQDEDNLLAALLSNPNRSFAELAIACDFKSKTGQPQKSKVQRRLADLKADKLVKQARGRWVLTDEGRKTAEKSSEAAREELVEVRGGAPGKSEFFPARGIRLGSTIPCIQCHVADGNVFKVKDGRLAKGRGHAEALHVACAKAWFEGR
jgi:hypothetical protein